MNPAAKRDIVLEALELARRGAYELAAACGTRVVVGRDGKTVFIDPTDGKEYDCQAPPEQIRRSPRLPFT